MKKKKILAFMSHFESLWWEYFRAYYEIMLKKCGSLSTWEPYWGKFKTLSPQFFCFIPFFDLDNEIQNEG